MKRVIFIPILLFSQDFITNLEYGKMLYNNPRGIGCIKCHNNNAKGKVIATYRDKGEKKELVAPNISNVKWNIFFNRLKYSKILKNGKFKTLYYSAMPRYNYLTNSEIKAIYNYIRSIE
jgi:mono/diheme cytochrome c family protein